MFFFRITEAQIRAYKVCQYVREGADQPAVFTLPASARSDIHRAAPRIPIAPLTSRVCAFGAAGLRRGLQGSFARVRGIGLHVWLLVVMVRV